MYYTVRFAGYGGYGVVTASRTLGLTFTQKGLHVLQTESHGAAARGGACTADLTVSTNPIYELGFQKPNVLIVLSTPAFSKCCSISPDLSSDLLLLETEIVNDPVVQMGLEDLPQNKGTTIYQVNIRQLADRLGHMRYMGVASLGALAVIDDRVEFSLLEQTIRSDNKLQRFEKENLKALHGGASAVTIHKS